MAPGTVPGALEEGGSVIAAYPDRDNSPLWAQKIHDAQRRASIETDRRTVLINSMRRSEDGSALMIGNELGETYRLAWPLHQPRLGPKRDAVGSLSGMTPARAGIAA